MHPPFPLLAVLVLLLSASASSAFTLSWAPSAQDGVLGYRVHHGPASGNFTTVLDVGAATSVMLPDPPPGATTFAVVTAYAAGGMEGPPSAEMTFTSPAPVSSNADLAALAPGTGSLTPAFAPSVTGYSARVSNRTTSITFTPTTADANATVRINGTPVASGTRSAPISLAVGTTSVAVSVTAQDGTTVKTYQIAVIRPRRKQDLNSDGKTDLVFQNRTGQIAAWYTDDAGGVTSAAITSGTPLNDWRLVASPDFNNDGTTDHIFQNTPGQLAVWHMDGRGGVIDASIFYQSSLGDWKVVAAPDLDNDDNADLVFQNTAGQIAAWIMDGRTQIRNVLKISSANLGDWKVAGVADLDGDGNMDLLFQNTAGQIAIWTMDGKGNPARGAMLSQLYLGDWKLAGTPDINDDGNVDLLFQNTAGQIAVWYMNGRGGASTGGTLYNNGLGDWRLR